MNFAKISLCCVAAVIMSANPRIVDALSLKSGAPFSIFDAPSEFSSDDDDDAIDGDAKNERITRRNERFVNILRHDCADTLALYLLEEPTLKQLVKVGAIDITVDKKRTFFNTNSRTPQLDRGRDVPTPSLYAMINEALSTVPALSTMETFVNVENAFSDSQEDRFNYLNDNTTSLAEMENKQKIVFFVLKYMVLKMASNLQKDPTAHYQRVKEMSGLDGETYLLVDGSNYLIYEADRLRGRSQLIEYGLLPSAENLLDVGNKLSSFTMKQLFELFQKYFVNRSLRTGDKNRGSLFVGPSAWNSFDSAVDVIISENEQRLSVNGAEDDHGNGAVRVQQQQNGAAGGCATGN